MQIKKKLYFRIKAEEKNNTILSLIKLPKHIQ